MPKEEILRYNNEVALPLLKGLDIHVDDIQQIVYNQSAFAKRIAPECYFVDDDVYYQARTIDVDSESFVNSYKLSFCVDMRRYFLRFESSAQNYYLRESFTCPDTIAAINGSFSFISDQPSYQPVEPCFDLCVRHGQIVSLPTITKPALVIMSDQIIVQDIDACGAMSIGGVVIPWRGSKDLCAGNDIPRVFNATNCVVQYKHSATTVVKRYVDRCTNVTPPCPNGVDLLVTADRHGDLFVSGIQPHGGSDLFAANFVVQLPPRYGGAWREGDRVEVLSVGGINAADILSASSLGPSVYDIERAPELVDRRYDRSLGNSPFQHVRYPRSIIYKTRDGRFHFRIFDGAPMTSNFKGLTPGELVRILESEGEDIEWAYHLDGGQSSKIAFRHYDDLVIRGSLHYLVWPDTDDMPFLWNGFNGRLLASSIVLCKRSGE